MKRFNLFIVLAFSSMVIFTSCKQNADATSENVEANVANTEDPNTVVETTTDGQTTPAEASPVATGPTTSIEFDQDTYDWGTIMDGDKVTHIFKFKNTGNEPLVINNAKGSCGCTVPEWPKDAIAPGKSGEIKVVYDSKGKGDVGGKDDMKRVTIIANTDPSETYIHIKGKVDKKPENSQG